MLKKTSLSKKLFCSNLLYGIPVVVLMILMVKAKNKDISFAEYEKYGAEYQRPLEELLENVSAYRLAVSRAASDGPQAGLAVKELEKKVERSFSSVEAVNAKFGEALQFTEEGLKQRKRENLKLESVKHKWSEAKARDQELISLIADIRGMITHLGDTSNLILDPDLDSYYLMDTTLIALPQIQDRIQEVTVFVEGILRRKAITTQERIQLNTYTQLLQAIDLDRIVASTQTALNEDRNFYGENDRLQRDLPQSMAEFRAAITALIELTRRAGASDQVDVDAATYQKAADVALSSSFAYWRKCADLLEELLQTRIESFETNRFWSVLAGILALAFAAAVSWFIAAGLRKSLGEAVAHLTESAANTNASSVQLVTTSNSLSSSSSEQAAAIQETVSTLNQINAMVNKSLENATKSAKAAEASQETATGGQSSVAEMIRAIEEISRSNEEGVQQINDIVRIINEIGSKTKVINDIVFQTKLLSFNASVEAARAGEHGKGFAVVAEEVGNLAAMSGNAAKEISSMLESSIARVNSIVEETKSKVDGLVSMGKSKVEAGTEVANRCGSSLEEIVRTVNEVNVMVGEIMKASEEQARGVNEITKAMGQLDQATHENASMSSETANHAEALSNQANDLRSVVSDIEQEVFGQSSAPSSGGAEVIKFPPAGKKTKSAA